MRTRQTVLKTILWAMVGVLLVVTVSRFTFGLGATTGLTDGAPWGLWIAFDVMAGVALAAGGFVLAATVYIFGRRRYTPYARPAILTAFLGYAAVAFGLLYDLGLPWHIWHPIIHPQVHSVLFEVAMCVMLYLTVLFLEFSPVILEHERFSGAPLQTIRRFLKRASIPLVIAGIVLSTLHQSSLGSLFLIAPHRLHALWYSPIIWILFFISAIGLGLMVVTAESYFSAWFFGHRLQMGRLAGLGRAAGIVLWFYAALRLGDLALRGGLGGIFDGSWQASVFMLELAMGALVPAILLLFRRVREHRAGLGICALLTIFGMIGYRFDVCIVGFARPSGMSYFPSWMEIAVSLGIVAGALLVFIFFVERLRVYEEEQAPVIPPAIDHRPFFEPAAARLLLPEPLAGPRRYSLAVITAAALVIALLPPDARMGVQPVRTPVAPTPTVTGLAWQQAGAAAGRGLALASADLPAPAGALPLPLILIDGNRTGPLVLFDHAAHQAHWGGEESCGLCHHQNMPFDRNTSCYQCHRDMYVTTDVFDHDGHVERLAGNAGCVRCHADPSLPRTRSTTTPCASCHAEMVVAGAVVVAQEDGVRGLAPGYMDAMHGLCSKCHTEQRAAHPERYDAAFAECAFCHRSADGSNLQRLGPYQSLRTASSSAAPAAGEAQ